MGQSKHILIRLYSDYYEIRCKKKSHFYNLNSIFVKIENEILTYSEWYLANNLCNT